MGSGVKSILLAGVGGQGILRASDILGLAAMEAGLDAKKSEVHGMAQRGGCVTSHVRLGKRVFSPLARKGDVDILVAFERLEALRYLDFLKPGGRVLLNLEVLNPPAVNLGEAAYPEDVVALVRSAFPDATVLDAAALARQAGNILTVNTVFLGALSTFLDEIPPAVWEAVLAASFPDKVREVNRKAFALGRQAVCGQRPS